MKAPLLWNGLPDSLHRDNNVETFKLNLKHCYLEYIICRST